MRIRWETCQCRENQAVCVSCLLRWSTGTGTLPQAARALAWIALHERTLSIPFPPDVECWECSGWLNCVTSTSPVCREGVCAAVVLCFLACISVCIHFIHVSLCVRKDDTLVYSVRSNGGSSLPVTCPMASSVGTTTCRPLNLTHMQLLFCSELWGCFKSSCPVIKLPPENLHTGFLSVKLQFTWMSVLVPDYWLHTGCIAFIRAATFQSWNLCQALKHLLCSQIIVMSDLK